MKIYYEVKAYKKGTTEAEFAFWGSGKGSKKEAVTIARRLIDSGKYEAVFVDAYNDDEYIDSECVEFYESKVK